MQPSETDITLKREAPPREGPARSRGIHFGRVFGIELIADYSLAFIFVLIVTNLGFGAFATLHPAWGPLRVWGLALLAAVAFFASIAVHELAHALVGRLYGVPVRRITLFVFGGMAHTEREPPSPRAEFFMAAAGPLVSVLIGLSSSLLARFVARDAIAAHPDDLLGIMRSSGPLATLLLWLGPVNLMLGMFNLIPGFPLDGGRVLRSVLWWATGNLERATRWASAAGQAFAWALIAIGVIMAFGAFVPGLGGGLVQGLWLMLIGWFLNNAARMSYQQMLLTKRLEHVAVREVMRSRVEIVSPNLTIGSVVRDLVMNTDQQAFPVVQEDEVVGLLTMDDIRRVSRERWDQARVGEVMTPASSMHAVSPDDDAMVALRELADQDPLPVIQDRHLVGVARRADILKWLSLHAPRPA